MKFKIKRINSSLPECVDIIETDTKEGIIKIADKRFNLNDDVVEIINLKTGKSEIIEKTLLFGSTSFLNTLRVKEMRMKMKRMDDDYNSSPPSRKGSSCALGDKRDNGL